MDRLINPIGNSALRFICAVTVGIREGPELKGKKENNMNHPF